MTQQELAALRDLNHTEGWEVYKRVAHGRIEQANKDYLQDSLTQEEAWEARTKVKAIMTFQSIMEEVVANALRELEYLIERQMYPVETEVDDARG